MKKFVLWTAAGVLVLGAIGCVDREAQKQSNVTERVVNNPVKAVTVGTPIVDSVSETVEITGDVTAGEDTTIGSKQTNKVLAVYVKDGDLVSAGQLLATLDDTSAQAQLKQAQAQLATAQASAAVARSQYIQATRNANVGPHKSTIQVLFAQAQVKAAQRNLDKLMNGARPEERRQADASLASAKATLDLQKKQLDRTRTLVEEGALPGQNLDQQQAAYDQAAAQYKQASEAVKIYEVGNRQEDIDSARANLQSAQENLRTAQDQKRLDPLLKDQVDAANAQVDSARAQLESAKAQIQIAQQAIADTKIFAPFAGRISGKPIQVGTVASGSTAIVRVVGGNGIYFTGQVPSSNVDKIHSGDNVQIHIDGAGDKPYAGKVVSINPIADSVGRLFSVRVLFTGDIASVRPGMFARGNVVIRTIDHAILVPSIALVTKNGETFAFVVVGNKAKQVKVTTGLTKGELIQVTGLNSDAKLVVEGQDSLVDGSDVNVKGTIAAKNDAASTGAQG